MKQAILVVSFGTSCPEAIENTIAATEQALRNSFQGWEVRRAFTGEKIIAKLAAREDIRVDDPVRGLRRLREQGYTRVAVQPTFVTHGREYEKLLAWIAPFRDTMEISVGTPLLHRKEDCLAVADALVQWIGQPGEGEALVFMGHGSPDFPGDAYCRMGRFFHSPRIFLAAMRGSPSFASVLSALEKLPDIRQVTLAPFLLVAGKHAKDDMAGDRGSWKAALEARGYEVRCILEGLGQCPEIRERFVRHCREAVERLQRDEVPERDKITEYRRWETE